MPAPETAWKVIRPGRLIDSLGGSPHVQMAVIIQGQRIFWVGPRDDVTAPGGPLPGATAGADYQVLDFPQATLLPGLIDCHTHTNMPGDGRTGEEVNQDTDDVRLLRSARNVRKALKSGVTTLCDCGSWNHTALSLRQGIDLGLVEGPRVLVAGRPVTCTGGHLWFMGGEADGVGGVRRQVRQLIKEGVDFIKVVASGGSTATSDPYRPSLSSGEIGCIVAEAHNRGKPVLAHCRSTVSINNALDAEVDVILHCGFFDPDGSYRFDHATAERLLTSEVWVNPTLNIGRTRRDLLRRKRDEQGLDAGEALRLDEMEQLDRERIARWRMLVEMGVNLVGGSDCGWGTYPFGDYQGEVVAMVDAGLSPMQAILAATRDSAKAMGLAGLVGTVEAGKEADLLLVEGNPSEDICTLRQPVAVFKGGVLV